jgi:NTP pyrophosphatase (non-canonical NTP hydrolase)
VKQLQAEVAEWVNRNRIDNTIETATLCVAEEAGELCRAVVKRHQGIRGSAEEWTAEIRKELADIIISASYVATLEGFDLADAVDARWQVIKERDFVRDPTGHGMPEEG